jgi:hypothetical protein
MPDQIEINKPDANDAPIGVPPSEFKPQRPDAPFKKSGRVKTAILIGILIVILDVCIYFFLIKPDDQHLLPKIIPSPSSSQLPSVKPTFFDETLKWKVYTNNKMKFSIKLPSGWFSHKEITANGKDEAIFSYPVDSNTTQVWKQGQEVGLSISSYKNNGIDASKEAAVWVEDIEKRTPNTFVKPLKTMIINGRKATVADTRVGNLEYIYVSNNDDTYVIIFGTQSPNGFAKYKPTFNQILSTLTFNNQNQTQIQKITQLARQDLASRLKIDPAKITVVSEEKITWNDGSMGCPKPGMMYTQALIDGTKVILSAEQKNYQYNAGSDDKPFICEKPKQ